MNEQLELPSHRADPETSREAARKAQPNAAAHRARILLHLYERGSEGATAWELYLATGGARPSGAVVWQLTSAGRSYVEALGETRVA